MWFTNEGQQLDIRHTCEHGDHLQKYGWTHHDGTTFGQQEILDDCTHKHHIAKSDLGLMYVCVPCHFISAKRSLPFTCSHFSKHRCCDSVTALPWGHMDGKVCPQTTDRPTQAGLPHPLRLQRRTWRDGLRQVTKELNRRNLWTYTRGTSGEREREREWRYTEGERDFSEFYSLYPLQFNQFRVHFPNKIIPQDAVRM